MNERRTETMMAASVVSLNMMKKMGAEKMDPMLNAVSDGRGLCVGRVVDERTLL